MNPLYETLIYLCAAVLAVPLAKRVGLGSVLGYLIAGVLIGPHLLGLVHGANDVMHIAEFGVVMMLFLIGLELKPALLWTLRRPIFGMGSAQVLGTAILFVMGGWLLGLPWKMSIAIGLILAMSSTAIVLQSLGERGLLRTPGGESAFAVLLFQDMAVIPILAVMPLLVDGSIPLSAVAHPLPPSRSAGEQTFLMLIAVGGIVLAGHYMIRPFLRYIAGTRLREMFTAAALFIVVGIAALMQSVGLSPALGTFVAGVLLADSEYRVQLETDIEPFKGILLGLFFMSVGASINLNLVMENPGLMGLLVMAAILAKFVVLFCIGKWFKLSHSQAILFGLALAQGGEFAFVLFSFATQAGVLPPNLTNLLTAAVVISMAIAPLLLVLNEYLVQPMYRADAATEIPDTVDDEANPVILAGFGRFGHIVGRLLRANGIGTTVLDHDSDQVETLRRFGLKSFYGDASRLDLLHAAGASRAKLFILAIDNEEKAMEIIALIQKHFPHLKVIARATSRQHAYELLRHGIENVYRETLGSALEMGVAALTSLGVEEQRARRAAQIFREHDEQSVRALAKLVDDKEAYASRARQDHDNLIKALEADIAMTAGDPELNRS